MTRPRLILVLLVAFVVVAMWLLGDGDEVLPGGAGDKPDKASVVVPQPERVADDVAEAGAPTKRELVSTPAPTGAKPEPAAKPRGPHGVVKELAGDGLADIRIELVDKNGVTVASTISGKGGRFAFEEPEPSGVWFASRPVSGDGPRLRHAALAHSRPRTRGPSGARAAMVLWRPPSGLIDGTVIDASGKPVAGAYVATDRPWMAMGMMSWTTLEGPEPRMVFDLRTDKDGRFVMRFVKKGKHRLRATYNGETGSAVCDAHERGVVLRLGAHQGGDVVLAGTLTDRVTGQPIAEARVSVMRVRKTPGGSSSVGVAQDVTDAQGRYELSGLDVGSYRLSSLPKGYAAGAAKTRKFEAGRHTIDLAFDPARKLRVRVVLPDGKPATGAEIRVERVGGGHVRVPGHMRMMSDSVRVDERGSAELRRLPATALWVRAIRGDFVPAGESKVDLSTGSPGEITIRMPTQSRSFARKHYFSLLGEDGKPVAFEGAVIASCFDGAKLVSRVRGYWRGKEFVFGNNKRNGFRKPMIPVGAPAGECRVEIAVPGYQVATLTLAPGVKSPSKVQLQR